MCDSSKDGIYLTKKYYKDFLPTDLQWTVAEVATNFTLYNLFHLVYRIEMIIPGICATFGMSQFDKFWEQINLPRDPDDPSNIEYLELYHHPDYETRITPKTGKSTDQKPIKGLDDGGKNYFDNPKICEMPNLMSFHGIGPGCPSKDYHKCNKNCPTETSYGIEFSPVNNLASFPIRVSPKVEFYPPFAESDRDFNRTGFELTIEPTLWCFITSIFWELTFAGYTPDAVANHSQEISDRMDEAKAHMKQINKKDTEEME